MNKWNFNPHFDSCYRLNRVIIERPKKRIFRSFNSGLYCHKCGSHEPIIDNNQAIEICSKCGGDMDQLSQVYSQLI